MTAHDSITSVRVGNDHVEIRPGSALMVDGHDWSWAFVVFRGIPGFPDYRVGTDGSMWSRLKRIGFGGANGTRMVPSSEWRRLKTRIDYKGYVVVAIYRDGKMFARKLHRIILEAFVGPCPDGMEGCHNNGRRADYRLINIRWGTRRENWADKVAHGNGTIGSRSGTAKLTEADVVEIRRLFESGESKVEIARRYGVERTCIYSIITRRSWSHVS